MSETTIQIPTKEQAAKIGQALLDARKLINDTKKLVDSQEDELRAYFSSTEEREVGPVLAWERSSTTYDLVATAKKYEASEGIAKLLEDDVFLAFRGERVDGSKVQEAALSDKTLYNSLSKRDLIAKVIDLKAVATAALDNPELTKALKGHHLKPEVNKVTKVFFKAA